MNAEPKTAADLLALPIRGGFGQIERIIDGRRVVTPVRPPGDKAFYAAEDTCQRATDGDGAHWALCRDDEGWCRRRVL